MKRLTRFVATALIAGLLVVTPIYVAGLLLLSAMRSAMTMVRPFARLLPRWLPATQILSLLLILVICFVIGVMVSTGVGRATWERIEKALFQKIPLYTLIRSLTQRLAGQTQDKAWEPALAEIENALVPAFIIEELEDRRCTVFVPAVPTLFTGAIFILTPDRVHPLNIPFSRAVRIIAHWGAGCKEMVAAMEKKRAA